MESERKFRSFLVAILTNIALVAGIWSIGCASSWASESSQYHRSKYSMQQKSDSLSTSNRANAIDVFSDTTSNADTVSTAASQIDDDWNPLDDTETESFDKIISALMAHGAFVGVILAIFGMLFALALCALPFLAIILPIVYLIKRSNNKTRITEKMIEQGVSMPMAEENFSPSNEALMQKGIQQTAIGVGLMILFVFMDIQLGIGIGGLVAAIGVGKIISAKVSKRKQSKTENDADDVADNQNY